MEFHRVELVRPEPDYILQVDFCSGEHKRYDIKPLFNKIDAFLDLKDIYGLYDLVKVDPGGYGISWNDEIDLSCNELWENGY